MKNVRLYQNRALSVGDLVTLDAYASHHLSKVLRFPEGKNITLFNGDGMNYSAQVLQTKKDCRVKILEKTQNSSESKLNLTLVQGIAKGEKMDFLIQKAVELGVNRIIPVFTQHCVVRFKGDKLAKRQLHWHKIVIGACEQSGRSVIPKVLAPINLRDFLQQPVVNGFVLHHRCEQTLLALTAVDEASILIGPEGGLSEIEINQANQAGYRSLLLGSRVLRTETASLAVIANMQLLWGS
ncbi:Ribosomal RNA small subunit methyltransferase E (EC [uncultured Gammaproteobacteria bacterium]|jgi:16S rRNA (uracil1498-N3)-methyltransferase|nr:16S rRNA (uracil(1498)-N(3))-methyltransferase (EC 2.1.1.193) [uncultured Gammaproteobacteria bacterium]VVH65446.1 Ribosomal RNA small subunit methyltransferase E (EC [uncultured Gammaproteobacteria bacterium]